MSELHGILTFLLENTKIPFVSCQIGDRSSRYNVAYLYIRIENNNILVRSLGAQKNFSEEIKLSPAITKLQHDLAKALKDNSEALNELPKSHKDCLTELSTFIAQKNVDQVQNCIVKWIKDLKKDPEYREHQKPSYQKNGDNDEHDKKQKELYNFVKSVWKSGSGGKNKK